MALEISYADKKIRNICDSEAVALRRLSPNVVKALMHRLTDLNSASNIMDVPLGNPREISGDPPGEYRLDLVDGYFLMFCAVDLKMPINDKSKVDWTKVSRLKLLRIIKDDA